MATNTKKKPTVAEVKAARVAQISTLERLLQIDKMNAQQRGRVRRLLWYYRNPAKRRAYLIAIGKARPTDAEKAKGLRKRPVKKKPLTKKGKKR